MFGIYRTYLALWVAAFHLLSVPQIGMHAVFSFYTLSGFLMTLIMQDRYGYNRVGRLAFANNRFLRLYPSYWCAAGLSILLMLFLGEEYVRSYVDAVHWPRGLGEWVQNLTMIFASVEPSRIQPRLSPATWALTVEIFYYCLICLGISKRLSLVVLWWILSVGYHAAVHLFHLEFSLYAPIPAASLPFSSGALLYFLIHRHQDTLKRLCTPGRSLLLVGISSLYPFGVAALSLTKKVEPDVVWGLYLAIFLAMPTIACLYTAGLPWVRMRWDKTAGEFSYPIYLLHWQCGALASWVLFQEPVRYLNPRSLASFMLSLVLMAMFSILIIHQVDARLARKRLPGSNSGQ